jgi:hypothetical protein
MKNITGDKISTDRMNDIIGEWVDAEMPTNPAGYEAATEGDRIREAQGKRFEQIVALGEREFRELFAAKTGLHLSAMNSDGSYTVE